MRSMKSMQRFSKSLSINYKSEKSIVPSSAGRKTLKRTKSSCNYDAIGFSRIDTD